jgi:phosphomevalonate kinase
VIANAPGKVLWAGEYAVLDGMAAVVMAVDRRVRAEAPSARAGTLSPFLTAAAEEVASRYGQESSEAQAARRAWVDSGALARDGKKLGLGSSAAATVAAIAAATGADRKTIHEMAHRAHAAAQAPRGARGSGADIAASVHGGLLLVKQLSPEAPLRVEPLPWPPGLGFVLVWTGVPADTPPLVAQVRALRERDPRGHATAMVSLGDAAADLADAFQRADHAAIISAVARGHAALAELAARSGAELVPPAFAEVRALAAAHDGAAKPTGAGGGDVVLTVFPDPEAAAAFRVTLAPRGMIALDTRVDPDGVLLAEASGTA